MTGSTTDEPEPDVMQIFDTTSDTALTCRVCGAMVAQQGDYRKVHWDWHEATNGA